MKRDLVVGLSLGPWQAASLAMTWSACGLNRQSDRLVVLYFTAMGDETLANLHKRYIETLFPQALQIKWPEDLPVHIKSEPWPIPLGEYAQVLSRSVDVGRVAHLYVTRPATDIAKLSVEIFSAAALHLYEEGLDYYCWPERVSIGDTIQRRVRTVCSKHLYRGTFRPVLSSYRLHDWHLSRSFERRVRSVSGILVPDFDHVGMFSKAKRTRVDEKSFVQVIDRLMDPHKAELAAWRRCMSAQSHPFAVLLWQNYSDYGLLPYDAEMALVDKIIKLLTANGYAVGIKPHPRQTYPFTSPSTGEIASRLHDLSHYRSMPVEMMMVTAPNIKYIGLYSTSLFIARRLQLAESFTFADLLDGQSSLFSMEATRIAKSYLPGVHEIDPVL